MILLKDLTVVLGGKTVISSLSAEIKGNAVILGPNGSGKTTLLKTIVGLYKPAGGVIEVEGFNLTGASVPPRLVSTNIESAYMLRIDLNDVIDVYCAIFRCDQGRLRNLLSYIRPKAKKLWKLSSGERKWVTTVLALLADTKVVLLDEPVEDLDPWLAKKLMEEIREESRKKQVVLTLHSIHFLRELDEWDVFLMFDGSLYGPIRSARIFNMRLLRGREPNAALVVRIRGRDYSLVETGNEGVALKDIITDLTNLYEVGHFE